MNLLHGPNHDPGAIVERAPRYMERDNWDGDRHRYRGDVHYRLYLNPRTNQPAVICVQDFDYLDYDARRILSELAWDTEAEAEAALMALMPAFLAADASMPMMLAVDLRYRTIAAALRDPDGDGGLWSQWIVGMERLGFRMIHPEQVAAAQGMTIRDGVFWASPSCTEADERQFRFRRALTAGSDCDDDA